MNYIPLKNGIEIAHYINDVFEKSLKSSKSLQHFFNEPNSKSHIKKNVKTQSNISFRVIIKPTHKKNPSHAKNEQKKICF